MTKHRVGGSVGANGYGTYQVRFASEKQKNFIKKLVSQKGYDLATDLDKLNVQGAGELITKLINLQDKVGYVDYATDKQISFAQSLIESKEGGSNLLNDVLNKAQVETLEKLSKRDVSELINNLRLIPDKKPTITEVGAYLYEGVVYSIRRSYVSSRLICYTYDKQSKKYISNVTATKKLLHKITPSHRLTLEQAIKYSAHTGVCCHCGRTLTLLKSVASGMGAWCAKKYH